MNKNKVIVIGGGLAGVEAANFLVNHGIEVDMYERRPGFDDEAHHTELLGELVCSNSLKNNDLSNACGLLKQEMREMDSITMRAAEVARVPAGGALAVDRDIFAQTITDELLKNPKFNLIREEVESLPKDQLVICATGPLASGKLFDELKEIVDSESLSFFDASAPIVKKDSLNMDIVYAKSRHSQSDEAYLNCPFTRDEYYNFVKELLTAKRAPLHSFDTKYFEGCLPIEVMASRGVETLRHGMLKPFGLNKDENSRPYAVAQLRQDTKLGDYYNLVGFQTNLTYGEQKRVFRMIPGLENAEFIRYGLMHRNSYFNGPKTFNDDLSLKNMNNVYIAGQLSGVEGYVESSMVGIITAIYVYRRLKGAEFIECPTNTVSGALLDYVTHACPTNFQPMNANWALFPTVRKKNRDKAIELSIESIKEFYSKIDE